MLCVRFFNLCLFIACIYDTIIKYFIYFFLFLYGICCTHILMYMYGRVLFTIMCLYLMSL